MQLPRGRKRWAIPLSQSRLLREQPSWVVVVDRFDHSYWIMMLQERKHVNYLRKIQIPLLYELYVHSCSAIILDSRGWWWTFLGRTGRDRGRASTRNFPSVRSSTQRGSTPTLGLTNPLPRPFFRMHGTAFSPLSIFSPLLESMKKLIKRRGGFMCRFVYKVISLRMDTRNWEEFKGISQKGFGKNMRVVDWTLRYATNPSFRSCLSKGYWLKVELWSQVEGSLQEMRELSIVGLSAWFEL